MQSGADAPWPAWAVNTFVGLSALLALSLLRPAFLRCISTQQRGAAKRPHTVVPAGFGQFQWSYLSVYLLIMMADWLQGPNMW